MVKLVKPDDTKVVSGVKQGLARVDEIYQNRSQRARELKAEGKKVIGYLCIYPVLEVMTALDLVPYRIFGDMRDPITRAGAYLPAAMCSFLRSILDQGLKGKYEFFDGIVMSHICDIGADIFDKWNVGVGSKYSYFIDTPHTVHGSAQEQHLVLVRAYIKDIEKFAGKKLTTEKLNEAIKLHNRQRALVRQLYELRKSDPPLVSGAEVLKTIVALMSLPVTEGNQLLEEVIKDVKTRRNELSKKPARLIIWGSIIDDRGFLDMIESLDANVVIDDTCVGSRAYFTDVRLTPDPVEGLAEHYLANIKCPRTYRECDCWAPRKDHMEDLETRFGYIKEYVNDWKVNGAVLQVLRYCETHGYELPAIRDYFQSLGIPTLYLEQDYTDTSLAAAKTRVQAFLEVIG